jgi:Mg2+-importing ATPase
MAFGNVMKYLLMETSSNFGNMFSMAGAATFLNFLPMLPIQILLNNLLYDLAQITIPTDTVDPSMVHKPKRWDMRLLTAFMVWIGPISSLFDFLTFWFMLKVLHADPKLFQTGWFIESIATQALVIFVIRTRNEPWKSRPSRALVWSTVSVVAIAVLIPFTKLGAAFGFVRLPATYFGFLAVAVATYLGLVELAKRRVLRHIPV